jgi:hypothetical protein
MSARDTRDVAQEQQKQTLTNPPMPQPRCQRLIYRGFGWRIPCSLPAGHKGGCR